MSSTVIDSKTESNSYGLWPAKEKIATTLSLLHIGDGQLGVNYSAEFSGIKSGHVDGGPLPIEGNNSTVVHASPKVEAVVSDFTNSGTYASIHIEITVEIPVIGTQTIYSQTLGGHYEASAE